MIEALLFALFILVAWVARLHFQIAWLQTQINLMEHWIELQERDLELLKQPTVFPGDPVGRLN